MTAATAHARSKALILATSVLAGCQTLVAAGSLADIVGPKIAALSVVIVAAAQVSLNTYNSQTVSQMSNTTTTTIQTTTPTAGEQ
jgi:hypothetical protein